MSKQTPKLPMNFPAHFLWGASSSAHQVEGGTHNQWTVWELENAKVLAQTAKYQAKYLPQWEKVQSDATDPMNYVSGRAADHYNRYEEDFAILKKMGLNSWRFSIEWSRIEPEEGGWNAEAIEHYRKYLQRLKELDIEPIVTLWHWTVPVWFEQKGGFTRRKNISYFVRFAEKVFEELGRDFRYVITLNEPEVYIAKGFIVAEWPPQQRSKRKAFWTLMNLLAAHKKVYKLAKRAGRKYLVSIAKNSAYHYAGDDAWLSRTTAGLMRYAQDYFILNRIQKYLDFIGLNYYFSNRYLGNRVHNPDERLSDLGWDLQPQNIEHVLKELYDRYELPIIITENGVADSADEHRKWWISQTLMAVNRALQAGVKVEGYLHWSLTDNFEWSSGFWPRFGLVAVDYATKRRTLRPSAVWFAKLLRKLR
jgi:beta-glucosidase